MIDHKLAKQLKDAGFPIRLVIGGKEWNGEKVYFDGTTSDDGQKIGFLIPTLSELIEACGEKFKGSEFVLWKEGNYWEAGYKRYSYDDLFLDSYGKDKNKDAAVVKLYIELNK